MTIIINSDMISVLIPVTALWLIVGKSVRPDGNAQLRETLEGRFRKNQEVLINLTKICLNFAYILGDR